MLGLKLLQLTPLALQHEVLHIDDLVAALQGPRRQHREQRRMVHQEIRMRAQIGANLGFGDAVGRRRRHGFVLVLRHSEACFAGPRIDCPVFFQSAAKLANPLSVSGCWYNCRITLGGMVPTWAPIFAASRTCMGWRIDATSTSVLRLGYWR